ncbi:hypothetical protein ACFY4C_37455 [Actinomadura viridis]|uniref:hypothetical protein n=1 Tax=Actinomadura viridis TaxID=58110 RepID=UPI00369FBEA2
MSLNTQYGGQFDADGRPQRRWPAIADLITTVRPHIGLFQELTGWGRDPRLQAGAERDLQKRGWPMRFKVAPSGTDSHTAVAYHPDTFCWRQWETKYSHLAENGYGVAVLAPVDSDDDTPGLTVISAHLTAYSADAAAREAQRMIGRLHRYGGVGLLGGDINHLPLGDDDPDWEALPPYNRSSRCLPCSSPDAPWIGNRVVGQVLATAPLVDVAGHFADETEDLTLRAPTAPGGIRVDQFHVTPNLVGSLRDYRQLPTASDHDAVVMTLDPEPTGVPLPWV